jgi:hypothetical protein
MKSLLYAPGEMAVDIDNANTEALLRYHRFHERLNKSIKVQIIGLRLLADAIEDGRPFRQIKDSLSKNNEFIGSMPDWTNPMDLVRSARLDIGRAGMDEITAAVNRWRDFRELVPTSHKSSKRKAADTGDVDRLEKVYHALGAKLQDIEFLRPVYKYFRLARDCIVHRDGLASAALADQSVSSDVDTAVARWVKETGEQRPPDILRLLKGENIEFSSLHAVSSSSILRLIALDLNRQVVQHVGKSGLVYLSAYEAFFAPEPLLDELTGRTMLRALNNLLSNRYRAKRVTEVDTAGMLRKMGLTKRCSKAFRDILEGS